MRDHPDHHDAELLLRLYDLRREEKLRQARDWFVREFHVESIEEFYQRYPDGTQDRAYFRMLVSYWDMAASIVNNGLIKEDFFFENTTEFWVVWARIKHLAPGLRERRKDPEAWKNLETLVVKFEKWMTKRAPEALDALQKLVVEGFTKK